MAITEVIRRGNRRRTRTLAQRSVGGLSAIALGAVAFTGVTHHPGSDPAASGGKLSGGNTLTTSTVSAAGNLTMTVKYLYRPHGKIKVISVTYSGDMTRVPKLPQLTLSFGPGLALGSGKHKGLASFGIGRPLPEGQHHFSGSFSGKSFNVIKNQRGVLPGNGSLSIVAGSSVIKWHPVGKKWVLNHPGLTAVVILTR